LQRECPHLTQSGNLAQRKIRGISKKNQTLLQACCQSGGYQLSVGATLGIVSRVRTATNCTSTLINGRHQLLKAETIVPTTIRARQRTSDRQDTERSTEAESIGTLWVVFYMLALGVASSSPYISRAIEFAALTAQ
jgi:hypothetical protein